MRYTIIFILFLGCNGDQNHTLPFSTGTHSEIVVVIDDSLWENKLNKTFSQVFNEPIKGLGKAEKEFNIIQINNSEFSQVFRRHKNIIIFSDNEKTQNDKWAKDQLVIQLNINSNTNSLLETFQKVKSIFVIDELNYLRKKTKKTSNKLIENQIKKRFNIEVLIPKKYTNIIMSNELCWMQYNPKEKDEISQILVFTLNEAKKTIDNTILNAVDSVFFKYIKGGAEHTFVKIEKLYNPHIEQNICRGLWRLENGFMGGPFIFKTYFFDKKTVISLAFTFSPNTQKRDIIKEFEAIL